MHFVGFNYSDYVERVGGNGRAKACSVSLTLSNPHPASSQAILTIAEYVQRLSRLVAIETSLTSSGKPSRR
jgi:hypothetical protein